MRQLSLSSQQRNDLIKLGKTIKNVKAALRIRVILALDGGYSIKEVAEILLLDSDTVSRWQKKYEKGQFFSDWLTVDYIGYEGKLTQQQQQLIEEFVKKHTITDCREVALFIKEKFAIEYTLAGVTKLLHRMDFVYKQVVAIPGKLDEKKQKEFLIQYQTMQKQKKADEIILFADGVHPTHNIHKTRAWIKMGEEKQIKTNTGRGRLNINGALEPETLSVTVHYSATINAQETIKFFDHLQQKYQGKKIKLIVDNATYYKNKEVKAYLKKPDCCLELIFLPPYSPNLNFIERLWKFMKKDIIGVKYREKFAEFEADVRYFFEHLEQYEDRLRPFIGTQLHLIKVTA